MKNDAIVNFLENSYSYIAVKENKEDGTIILGPRVETKLDWSIRVYGDTKIEFVENGKTLCYCDFPPEMETAKIMVYLGNVLQRLSL